MPPTTMPAIRTIAVPADTNPAGDISGRWLMAQMDMAAGSAATLRAGGRCATVAVDAVQFLSPVMVGDEVNLYADIVHIGRSSIKIAVEAWRRGWESHAMMKMTDATFTFVAIEAQRRPRALPPESGMG